MRQFGGLNRVQTSHNIFKPKSNPNQDRDLFNSVTIKRGEEVAGKSLKLEEVGS